MARFLESRGMVAEALEVATDPDYRFELAIQLGRLEIAKVHGTSCTMLLETNSLRLIIVVGYFCRRSLQKSKASQNGSSWEN